LGLLNWSSNFVFSLILYLVFWLYFSVDLLNFTFLPYWWAFHLCYHISKISLHFQNSFLFMFHGYNINDRFFSFLF
jgi:hypothetical protein